MQTDTRKDVKRVAGTVAENLLRDTATAVATVLVVPDWVLTSNAMKVAGATVWLVLVVRSAARKKQETYPVDPDRAKLYVSKKLTQMAAVGFMPAAALSY